MKRGFTLIELLAVIVILAIIALIAVPTVLNIINDSKKESLKRSMDIYIDTVEKRVTQENMKKKFNPQYCEGESGEKLTCYDNKNTLLGEINIEIKNKIPKNVKLYFNNGKVLKDDTLELEIEGYLISGNEKGELVLISEEKIQKKCVLYADVLDGEKLTQSEYVDYTGYTEYTGGMTIEQAYAAQNMTFTTATFDNNTKKWTVGSTGDGYGAYYTVQESGYYQVVVENGGMTYVMNSQDEAIATEYMNFVNTNYMVNNSSEIEYLNAGEKILIMNSTTNSSFYITKSNKEECKKWRNKYKIGTQKITTAKNYIGYYADVDSDGYVDGVIYADLAFSKSGEWENSRGTYSYTAQTNLKEYTISSDKFNEAFGKKEVITPKENSLGNNRFYIINLEDFVKGSLSGMANDTVINGIYSWYLNVYDEENEIGRMNTWETDTSIDFGTGYANTGKIIEIWNKNGTGAGSYEDATQSDYDIFKHIQTKYQEGWYIPSRGEWAAFADSLKQKEDNPLTHNHESGSYVANSGNYNSIYKLSDGYWSSSQYSKASTWIIDFSRGSIESCGTLLPIAFARLGTTF